MSIKLPKVIGHRGACEYAPENTLESIKTAASLDAKWVEVDVKLTKDHIPVLFHDETLERTTNGSGKIADITYNELCNLEAGSWYAESFSGIKVPTLEEAAEILINHDMGLNLEIKPCPGREKETAEIALDHLSRIWDDHNNLLISSFQHVSLEAAMDVAADWSRGLLLEAEWPENWADLVDYLGVVSVNVNGNAVTREQVEALMDLDMSVVAYTINDPDVARRLQSWGVDSIVTDAPDVIEANLFTVH
jgi:glycerophosphoryl diester phosphodiesterase